MNFTLSNEPILCASDGFLAEWKPWPYFDIRLTGIDKRDKDESQFLELLLGLIEDLSELKEKKRKKGIK